MIEVEKIEENPNWNDNDLGLTEQDYHPREGIGVLEKKPTTLVTTEPIKYHITFFRDGFNDGDIEIAARPIYQCVIEKFEMGSAEDFAWHHMKAGVELTQCLTEDEMENGSIIDYISYKVITLDDYLKKMLDAAQVLREVKLEDEE